MRRIKVLLIRVGSNPNFKLGFLRYFDSVLNSIRKRLDIHEIWIVEREGSHCKTYSENVDEYNIYSFRNANELMEKLQPDLVLVPGGHEFLARSLLIAARHRKIPTAILWAGIAEVPEKRSTKDMVSKRSWQFRIAGRTFLKKYYYLVKTLLGAGYNFYDVGSTIFEDVRLLLRSFGVEFRPNLADLYFCSNYEWAHHALENGIPREDIIVVGEYSVDHTFQRISQLPKRHTDDKIKILLVTTGAVSHGDWTPKMHKKAITDVIKDLKKDLSDIAEIQLKIHPTAEKLDNYKNLINTIDPFIKIYQEEDLLDLFNQADLIVSYGQSTSLLQAVLLYKPLFILNLFNEDPKFNQYLKEGVAIELNNTKLLIQKIRDGSYVNVNEDNVKAFIEKMFYKFDGRCGERTAEHLVNLLDRYKRIP